MDQKRIKIVVCGGGNGSHATVATTGSKYEQFEVNVFTRRPSDWNKEIIGLTKGSSWESKGDFKGILSLQTGKISKCSDDPRVFG